jgi:hypothetical protein
VTATVTVTPTVTATQPPGQMADLVRYTYDSFNPAIPAAPNLNKSKSDA